MKNNEKYLLIAGVGLAVLAFFYFKPKAEIKVSAEGDVEADANHSNCSGCNNAIGANKYIDSNLNATQMEPYI